jgi:hypothetical protein
MTNTPGPWTIETWKKYDKAPGSGEPYYIYEILHNDAVLARVENNEANARLIAASPKMLDALKGFQKAWDEGRLLTSDECANIRAAIAAAEE